MEQNIKPILWVRVPGRDASPELIDHISKDLTTRAADYLVIITLEEVGEVCLQVLSPYKDNGEIPEELLTWLKNQNDGNS